MLESQNFCFKISSNAKIFIVSSSIHHFTGEYSQPNKVRKSMGLKEKSEFIMICRKYYWCQKHQIIQGAWVAQSVKRLTSAQVMISQFVGSSPTLGSALTAQVWSLLWIVYLPLSLSLPHSCSVSLSKINKTLKKFKKPTKSSIKC